MADAMLIVMAGQSNLWGQSSLHSSVASPAPSDRPHTAYDDPADNAFIWSKLRLASVNAHVDDGAWEALQRGYGFQNPPAAPPTDYVGCEMAMVHTLRTVGWTEPIYIIKYAAGGSQLAYKDPGLCWHHRVTGTSGDEQWILFRDFYLAPAITALHAIGGVDDILIGGFLWGQGAADCKTDISTAGSSFQYGQNLHRFIHDVVGLLGANGNAQVPLTVLQRETNLDTDFKRDVNATGGYKSEYHPDKLARIIAAQEAIAAANPRVRIFNSDSTPRVLDASDLGLPDSLLCFGKNDEDNEHFSGDGVADFGHAAAVEMARQRVLDESGADPIGKLPYIAAL
jgi:hypothetical protein